MHTVHVHCDCFYRSGSVWSVDDACTLGPQVARWSVLYRRRASRLVYPRYLRQLSPTDEILIRRIRTRRRRTVEESAVRGSCRGERGERENGSRTGD